MLCLLYIFSKTSPDLLSPQFTPIEQYRAGLPSGLYSLHTFKFKSMSRKIYVIWGECKKTKRVLEASMQRKKNMMRWLDFELQCFDKMQASQAASWTREKWPAASYWRQPGHWPSSQSVTTDQRLESPESAPTCQTVLTVLQSCRAAVFTLMSCSFLGHQQQASECGEGWGFEDDAWKEIVRQKSKVPFFSLLLVGTKASQFQAWQFWLWWNISWKWRELSSSRNGLAFPHFTIPYW